jgi:hypothetical protein
MFDAAVFIDFVPVFVTVNPYEVFAAAPVYVNGFVVFPTVREVPKVWATLRVPEAGVPHVMVNVDPVSTTLVIDGAGTVVAEIPAEVARTFPPCAIAWTVKVYAVESDTVNEVFVAVSPVLPRVFPF